MRETGEDNVGKVKNKHITNYFFIFKYYLYCYNLI